MDAEPRDEEAVEEAIANVAWAVADAKAAGCLPEEIYATVDAELR